MELKSCPFCGGKATVLAVPQQRRCFVTCSECGVETPRTFRTVEAAVNLWNKREGYKAAEEREVLISHTLDGVKTIIIADKLERE